jgi:hypothetical protein
MSEHTTAYGELRYISCDAPEGCPEIVGKNEVTFGYTPQREGWTTNGLQGDDRRYFCGRHAHLA